MNRPCECCLTYCGHTCPESRTLQEEETEYLYETGFYDEWGEAS